MILDRRLKSLINTYHYVTIKMLRRSSVTRCHLKHNSDTHLKADNSRLIHDFFFKWFNAIKPIWILALRMTLTTKHFIQKSSFKLKSDNSIICLFDCTMTGQWVLNLSSVSLWVFFFFFLQRYFGRKR